MTWLAAFGSKAWGWLLGAVAVVGGLLAILAGAKKAGKDQVKADAAEQEVKNAIAANKVSQDVNRTPTGDVQQRLRDKWSRD